jgi:hypothetical protein
MAVGRCAGSRKTFRYVGGHLEGLADQGKLFWKTMMTRLNAKKALQGSELVLTKAKVPTWTKTDELLAPSELAERWRMSVRTLDRWRADFYGPAWLALGGRVLYRLDDVLKFEAKQHRPRP